MTPWDTEPDPFFTPLDAAETADTPPVLRPRRASLPASWPAQADLPALLAPLAAAQDALARLDARAATVPPALRDGLIARLAFHEAAGWLAATHAWVHPHDLALRARTLTGGFDAALRAGTGQAALPNTLASGETAWTMDADPLAPLRDEAGVAPALHLARLLWSLPRRHDPLATIDAAAAVLAPLGHRPAADFDADRFARWRATWRPLVARRGSQPGPALPPLLAAASAAQGWMEAGVTEKPTAAQALAVAALLLARTGALRVIPLPVWSAWPALGRPGSAGLPRLRASTADFVGEAGQDSWPLRFLCLVAESTRAGLRLLDQLETVAQRGAGLCAGRDRRSRLPEALAAALRVPALTPKALARSLRITPDAAARLLGTLADAGLVAEITGRRSFRAFAVGTALAPAAVGGAGAES